MRRGMVADVYLGQDESLQRQVILKLLRLDFMDNEDRRRQFQQEASTLAQLKHPHIIQLFSIDKTDEERPYLVLPYIDGGTVRDELDKLRLQGVTMPAVTALDLVHQVADALVILHDQQVVHGAIQPEHILLRREKTAVLPSLGRAYWPDLPMPSQWPLYVAPEQAAGGQIDARTDIYGLGLLAYELLTGKHPFIDPGTWPMQPVPIHSVRGDLASETAVFIHRCLAAEPQNRYRSIPELLIDLEAAIPAEGGRPYTSLANVWQVYPDQQKVVRKEDLRTPTPVTQPSQPPERRWPVYLVALLVIAALFFAGWWTFLQQLDQEAPETIADAPVVLSPILPQPTETVAVVEIIVTSTLAPVPTVTPSPQPTSTPTITPTPTRSLGPETTEIGQSVLNRPIEAVRFGDGEHVLILIGGFHAGFAPASVELADVMIGYFTDNPDEVPDNVTLYIIPNANPDTPNFPGDRRGRLNANNVDINRNWDCRWQPDAVLNGEPVSGGTAVFSEPETITLRDFIQAQSPAGVIFYQARAAGGLSSPGACGVTPQVSARLAQQYGDAADYRVDDFETITHTILNGDATNWLDDQQIPAISVLLPDYDDMDWEHNKTAVLALLESLAEDE